jgi:hypothetical protein
MLFNDTQLLHFAQPAKMAVCQFQSLISGISIGAAAALLAEEECIVCAQHGDSATLLQRQHLIQAL